MTSVTKIEPLDYTHKYDDSNPLDALAQELERKLTSTMTDRIRIDERMVSDLRLYHGKYDPDLESKFKRSKVFIKLTRAKTNAAEAQLVDLLFPSDDKNWGIKPTPDPEISAQLMDDQPAVVDGQQYQDDEGNVITTAMLAQRKQELVEERCRNMATLIEDQLVEARYNASARVAIHDACVVGTGILKGPVVTGKMNRVYAQIGGVWKVEEEESFVPAVEVVRPWDFYPDLSGATIDEAEFTFERRYMSKTQVRKLAKRKGFSAENINRLLRMEGQSTQHKSSFQDDVRKLAGLSDTLNDTRFETWEYRGPIAVKALVTLGIVEPAADPEEQSQQELDDVQATVFYCGGVVLGARIDLMDYSRDSVYRVFNWEQDDACIFGYGVPAMVTDEQSIINSTWRMILDNGGVTAGPQIGLNKKLVTPANGVWDIEPFKLWEVNGQAQDIKQAISTFEFQSRLQEMSNVYSLARVMFDEVSGVPMLQQGEQGPSTQTLGGMSMLMNAANAVRRRQVKAFDDNITAPLIADFYHFNMLHSKREDVKGDYQVDARGTSALLVKETQAQALTNFLSVIGSNPVFAPILQLKAVQILRQWARTQSLPESMLPSDDDIKAFEEQQKSQSQGQPQDPAIQVEQLRQQAAQQKQQHEIQMEQARLQSRQQEMQFEAQIKMQLAAVQERIEMAKLAQSDKHNTEQLLTELKKLQAKTEAEWQQFMAELNVKKQAGLTANYGLGE